jgi:hypothetical protein
MKRCPHCHEDSFGIRELFGLDYFGADECKSCGRLVRNDGLRQFLVIPTILFAIFLCFPLLSSMPDGWEPFFLPLCAILIAAPQLLLAKPVKADEPEIVFPPFTPDPENDKTILVAGWNEEELRQIVADFVEEGRADLPKFKVEIQKRFENSFRLTFPEDIPPLDFVSFINYLAYPIDFGLAGQSIVVAGKATLNLDFEGIPEALIGKKAIFYLPEDDQDYDVVCMQTETGTILENSIGRRMVWRRVSKSLMGNDVKRLLLEA